MPPLNSPAGHLLHNLMLFGRLLRGLGLDVNPGRIIDLVGALALIDIGRKADFHDAARSLLVHRREDLALFDAAFELFWRAPSEGWSDPEWSAFGGARRAAPPATRRPESGGGPRAPRGRRAREDEESPPLVNVIVTYSDRRRLRRKDFAELTGEELAAIKRLMAAMDWEPGRRRTRRQRPGEGHALDLRRTLRRNLKYGGEVFQLARREPKFKPRPLVILADISGSMERYTRLLLHFVYSLAAARARRAAAGAQSVEAFVFSTQLTRITRQLRGRDVDQALREVARTVPDWAGGTRTGDALKTFNFEWGRRVLGRGAVVLLISDGWDRGDPALLAREMQRLQRSSFRLIWLNPLLGSPQYEPLTRGMQAALPFVDDFLPVHNLASLDQLAGHLAGLEKRRRR